MSGFAQRGWLRLGSAVLYCGVLGLLFAVSDPVQAGAVLFVIPVALLALADGLRGGLAGAAIAAVLTAVWVTSDDIDLEWLGWASRITAFLVIGILVGAFEDLARRHVTRDLGERYAAELHDSVVQSLVLAQYAMRDGQDASPHVEQALENAKVIISERLGEVQPGDLRLSSRP